MAIDIVLICLVASKGNTKAQDMVKLEPMMRLVLYCIDRVRKFKLGKDVSIFINSFILVL
jgi:hypothetical protein